MSKFFRKILNWKFFPILFYVFVTLSSLYAGWEIHSVYHNQQEYECALNQQKLDVYKNRLEGFEAGYDAMFEEVMTTIQRCNVQNFLCEARLLEIPD